LCGALAEEEQYIKTSEELGSHGTTPLPSIRLSHHFFHYQHPKFVFVLQRIPCSHTTSLNMPSYLITGASRGLGVSPLKLCISAKTNWTCQFEFLRQLSRDAGNTVIALVRNKAATEKSVAQELPGRKNIHIVQADVEDYEALKVRLLRVQQ
jgi:hypothetical protein